MKTSIDEGVPTRLFKVVFVGDSGVGKTSILQRFCTNSFKTTYSATVGVDFQIKTLELEGERIALQLWDTAGQERFRSMTQQYFRKTDGIILVYDVTCETSFKNMRNWMNSIKVRNCAIPYLNGKFILFVKLNNSISYISSPNEK
ncbi:ras-related protein Rab-13-like [Parasteatoda tepidariorum]|uniref:ras-related protein Rab-13-like n=1 Tax=Parasteatoda tepidariorum TaxID=114398 RepID=UPI001C71DE9B|nr:ras-related protein Rab-13-like [Parasteatoda tepidariorum]